MSWPERWRARWIWFEAPDLDGAFARAEPPERPLDGIGYLRTTLRLTGSPDQARCRVTADSRYVLHVNRSVVGRGPVRSWPWRWTYDEYDLAQLLTPGENVVGATVRCYGGPTNAWVPAQPVGALGFGSFLFEADIDGETVVSDETWRGRAAPYEHTRQHEGPPPAEIIDGRGIPWGWDGPGFDDSGWARAVVVDARGPGLHDPRPPTDPFPRLDRRPIPQLAEREIEATSDGEVFDLGGIANVHPILTLDADAGTVIEVTAGEVLDEARRPVLDVRRWRMRYTTAGRPGETLEAFEPVGARYLRAEIVSGAARAIEVRAKERVFPLPGRASFRCSDPALEEIWHVGVRTLEACSTDAFLDCPGREQRAWLGDCYGHTLVMLLLEPEAFLVRWMLRLHASGRRPDGLLPMVAAGDFGLRATTIPDQSLLWVMGLAHTWRWTGDTALVEELLPVAEDVLGWFERHRGGDGLLRDVPGWIFIDWAQLERGRTFAPLDGLYALALNDAAAMAEAVGDMRTAGGLRARADHTRAAFEAYWDPARGIYVDTVDGSRISQHANALAIACGAADLSRWDRILATITSPVRVRRTRTPGDEGSFADRLRSQITRPDGFDDATDVVEAQPFFAHFLHRALRLAGREDLLLSSIRRWHALGAEGVFPEYWESRPGWASLCHAWSAVPLYDLATYVLGIRPVEPGRFAVEQHLGDLTWAAGTIATPHGWMDARARDAAGRSGEREEPPGSGGTPRERPV